MKLTCIQAIKMDALKSVRVESTPDRISQDKPLGEVSNTARLTEAVAIDDIITNSTSEEPNIIEECSKKHLREGEYFRQFIHLIDFQKEIGHCIHLCI